MPHGATVTPLDTSGVLTGDAADLIASLWRPRFPSPDLVEQAAALVPRISEADQAARRAWLTEGPRTFIRIGPGVISVRSKDYARAERTAERAVHRHLADVDQLAAYHAATGRYPDDPEPSRTITEWSAKSQSNMTETLPSLDLTPMMADPTRVPGMLTLTYPGCWLAVAPSGKAVKAQLKKLRKRYERAWGEPLRCVWKLEFQRRLLRDANRRLVLDEHGQPVPLVCECEVCSELGDDGRAPHIHMMMVPPHGTADGLPFRQWISQVWAECVEHPDPEQYANHVRAGTGVDYAEGMRAFDPRRFAVYFLKHGTYKAKAYQHIVPAAWSTPATGPGRFWGYWGLHKATASVELDQFPGTLAGRTCRRWSAAQQVTRQVTRLRVRGGRVIPKYAEVEGLAGAYLVESRPPPKYRKTRTRARRMRNNRGYVVVNDGPAMASQLARYLDQATNRPVDSVCTDTSVTSEDMWTSGRPVLAERAVAMCDVCGERLASILADRGRHLLCQPRRPEPNEPPLALWEYGTSRRPDVATSSNEQTEMTMELDELPRRPDDEPCAQCGEAPCSHNAGSEWIYEPPENE